MNWREDVEALACEFERRASLTTAQLCRVTKQRLLAKCASDLRELLSDPRYEPTPISASADAGKDGG